MRVYFDNAATSRVSENVAKKMTDVMINNYGNPAAMYIMGLEAEKELISAQKTLAAIIGCNYDEIYFTSGGSEGDNLSILGTAKGYSRVGKNIITTKIEHPAVSVPFKNLEAEGFNATYLTVDSKGYINLDELKNSITNETILVSIILINNETGTIQNIEEIGKIIKDKNPKTIFHVDAVQAFGKYKINVRKAKVDLLTVSGHKFHCPKGLGFQYVRNGLKVKPMLFGGEQQRGLRAGTENPAGASALAEGAKEAYENLENNEKKVREIKEYLMNGILNEIPDTFLNGDKIDKASPYVLNISFANVRSEVLLHSLEDKGIFVSSGSACNSKNKHLSSVLTAMGVDEKLIGGAIRFSFSKYNTMDEAIYTLDCLKEIIPMLRRFNR